jgi:adenylate cyclase
MASSMSGSETIRMLNEVHEHLVSCIFLTGGTLDKYLGDGVMAYFGAPIASADHADRAVECSLMMRAEIQKLNEKRLARGDHPISLGIGIHSGAAVVGDIGAEIRREFTIIGDTVNTASRIESLTKKHQVDLLLTGETKSRLTRKYQLRSLGYDEIRGSNRTLETFTL